jgi:hypothetical protein
MSAHSQRNLGDGFMDNSATKDGWQRFLDRLKELWGKRADEERRDSRSAGSPATLEPLKAPDNASAALLAARRAKRAAPMNAWEDEGGAAAGQAEGALRDNSARQPAHFRFAC